MKTIAFFFFAAVLSLNTAAQVHFSVDSTSTGIRSKATGQLSYKTQSTKSSVDIADNQITLTDDLGNETVLRVFEGQADVITQMDVNPGSEIFLQVINDKTGEFWDVHYSTGELGEKSLHISNDTKIIHFYGKQN